MAIATEVRRIVTRVIDRLAADPEVIRRDGIDKVAWRNKLSKHMEEAEPVAHRAAVQGAWGVWYASLIDSYIRHSKNEAVENMRDLDRIAAKVRKANRLVQLKIDRPGRVAYLAKREIDCTILELEALGRQYAMSAASDSRRSQYYFNIARQMRLRGLSNDATLAVVLNGDSAQEDEAKTG